MIAEAAVAYARERSRRMTARLPTAPRPVYLPEVSPSGLLVRDTGGVWRGRL